MSELTASSDADLFAWRSAVARRYIDAVNAKDVDAILALYAEDALVMDPVGRADREFRGKEQLRRFYEGVVTRAQLQMTGPVRGGHGDTIACEVRAFIPGYEIDVITLTSFDEGGLIREYRAFWGATNMRQTDAGR